MGVTLHRKIIEPETSISGALALLFPCRYPLISPPLPDLQYPMLSSSAPIVLLFENDLNSFA